MARIDKLIDSNCYQNEMQNLKSTEANHEVHTQIRIQGKELRIGSQSPLLSALHLSLISCMTFPKTTYPPEFQFSHLWYEVIELDELKIPENPKLHFATTLSMFTLFASSLCNSTNQTTKRTNSSYRQWNIIPQMYHPPPPRVFIWC